VSARRGMPGRRSAINAVRSWHGVRCGPSGP
jgi:hypothetical protein